MTEGAKEKLAARGSGRKGGRDAARNRVAGRGRLPEGRGGERRRDREKESGKAKQTEPEGCRRGRK